MDEKNYRNAPAALGQIAVRAATLGLCSRRRGKQEGRRVANVIIRVQSIEAHAGHMAPSNVGEWLSLVEHLVRDQGVGGSNPLSPTNPKEDNSLRVVPQIHTGRLTPCLEEPCFHVTSSSSKNASTSTTSLPQRSNGTNNPSVGSIPKPRQLRT